MKFALTSRLGNLAVGALLVLLAVLSLLWQSGAWSAFDPGRARLIAAIGVTMVYGAGCIALLMVRRKRSGPILPSDQRLADSVEARAVLVVYASQTGYAEQLAQQTTESLRSGGIRVKSCSMHKINGKHLQDVSRALFVVSTTGEGDAPDMAARFVSDTMDSDLRLSELQYAVLALGDSDYVNYCGFGHELDRWLQKCGAQALFDLIEVDDGDAGSLRHWQYHLGQLSGRSDLPDWKVPEYSKWRLLERHLVNPGSAGDPCFQLLMKPVASTLPNWQAGDIAEIGPQQPIDDVDAWLTRHHLDGEANVVVYGKSDALRNVAARSSLDVELDGTDPQGAADRLVRLPHRDYSIASIPADGGIELLLRQWRRDDGTLGVGTGWLTEYAEPGAEISLRIRVNKGFHVPIDARPILLIGNGTGMASLRALLRQRISQNHHRNWLIFGERNMDRDFHYGRDILAWKAGAQIERLDLAFSRDQSARVYVQDLLERAAESVREWVAEGAVIYVCGSLKGMAPGVDAALRRILGDTQLQQLASSSRYLRDVY